LSVRTSRSICTRVSAANSVSSTNPMLNSAEKEGGGFIPPLLVVQVLLVRRPER